jgi:hypothetical protein
MMGGVLTASAILRRNLMSVVTKRAGGSSKNIGIVARSTEGIAQHTQVL